MYQSVFFIEGKIPLNCSFLGKILVFLKRTLAGNIAALVYFLTPDGPRLTAVVCFYQFKVSAAVSEQQHEKYKSWNLA